MLFKRVEFITIYVSFKWDENTFNFWVKAAVSSNLVCEKHTAWMQDDRSQTVERIEFDDSLFTHCF